MADEVLHPVDHVVVAVANRAALHAAHVGACVGLAHRHAVHALAANGGQQELFDLAALARAQDVRRPSHDVLQRVRRGAELAVHQRDAKTVEAATAELGGHVRGVQTGIDRLALDLGDEILRHVAQLLDHLLVRHQLLLGEAAHGVDDHLLLVGEFEEHCYSCVVVSAWEAAAA